MKTIIKNATLLQDASIPKNAGAIVIKDGVIRAILATPPVPEAGDESVDAHGMLLIPAF